MMQTLISQNTKIEKSQTSKKLKVHQRQQKLQKRLKGKNVKKASKINFNKISENWTRGTYSKKTMLRKILEVKPGANTLDYPVDRNKEASANLDKDIKNQWRYEKYLIAKNNLKNTDSLKKQILREKINLK
jgi:hypothetical protein